MRKVLREILRYRGLIASFAFSFANFVLAYALQKTLAPADFGVFAIVQVYLQFGLSLSNALFCAPILLEVGKDGRLDPWTVASFSRANILACLAGAALVVMATWVNLASPKILALIAILMVVSWSRWFYRAVELAEGNVQAPFLADIYYALAVLGGTGLVIWQHWVNLAGAVVVLIAGSIAAMLSLSRGRVRAVRQAMTMPLDRFGTSFMHHGKWALAGVVTTEATANGYAYMVAGALGPAAFAPIAAINLFFRPITIVIQTLTQYERPKMIRHIHAGTIGKAWRDLGQFRRVAVVAALGNFALVLGLLLCFPSSVGNRAYPVASLLQAAVILGLIYFVRAMRAADSAMLQALGAFRPLAWITVYTAPVSLVLVGALLWFWPQAVGLSLVGVLIGEVAGCLLIIGLLRMTLQHPGKLAGA